MSSQATKTHREVMLYACSDQSMWRSGSTAVISADTGESLYAHIGPLKGDDDNKFLGTGTEVDLDMDVRCGLRFHAEATAGSVNLQCPVQVDFIYPQYIPAESAFRLDTALRVQQSATLSTFSPNVGVSMYGGAYGHINVGAQVQVFGKDFVKFNIDANDISSEAKIIEITAQDVINKALSQLQLAYPSGKDAFIEGSLNFPVINTTGKPAADGRSVYAEGRDFIFGLDFDITNFIAYLIGKVLPGFPPLANEFAYPTEKTSGVKVDQQNDTSDAFRIAVAYKILDLVLHGEIGLMQRFRYTPTPTLLIEANDGFGTRVRLYRNHVPNQGNSDPLADDETVPVGTQLWADMPASGFVCLKATLYHEGQFQNTTGLYVAGGAHFVPLSLSAEGEIFGVSLPGSTLEPLGSYGQDYPADFPIADLSPTLALTQRSQPCAPFTLVRESPPLAAIATCTPDSCDAYNGYTSGDGLEDNYVREISITSDGPAWPDLSKANPTLRMSFDGRPIQVRNDPTDPTKLVGLIQATWLAPGAHTLTSHVRYDDWEMLDVKRPLERYGTVSFTVRYKRPQAQQLVLAYDDTVVVDRWTAGEKDQTGQSPRGTLALTLRGRDFAPDTKVEVDGQLIERMPASLLSSGRDDEIHFALPLALLDRPLMQRVGAVSPDGQGGLLRSPTAAPLSVLSRTPVLYAVIPIGTGETVLRMNGGDTTVILRGKDFLPGCSVLWSGTPLQQVRRTSSTTITAVLPAALLKAPIRSAQVVVANQQDDRGTPTRSAAVTVSLVAPRPVVTEISPRLFEFDRPAQLVLKGRFVGPTVLSIAGKDYQSLDILPEQATFALPNTAFQTCGPIAAVARSAFGAPNEFTKVMLRTETTLYQYSAGQWRKLARSILENGPGLDQVVVDELTLYGVAEVDAAGNATGLLYRAALPGPGQPPPSFTQIGTNMKEVVTVGGRPYALGRDGLVYEQANTGWRCLDPATQFHGLLATARRLYGKRMNGGLSVYDGAAWRAIDAGAGLTGHMASRGSLWAWSGQILMRYLESPGAWVVFSPLPCTWAVAGPGGVAVCLTAALQSTGTACNYYDEATNKFRGFGPVIDVGDRILGSKSLLVRTADARLMSYDLASGSRVQIGSRVGRVVASGDAILAFCAVL